MKCSWTATKQAQFWRNTSSFLNSSISWLIFATKKSIKPKPWLIYRTGNSVWPFHLPYSNCQHLLCSKSTPTELSPLISANKTPFTTCLAPSSRRTSPKTTNFFFWPPAPKYSSSPNKKCWTALPKWNPLQATTASHDIPYLSKSTPLISHQSIKICFAQLGSTTSPYWTSTTMVTSPEVATGTMSAISTSTRSNSPKWVFSSELTRKSECSTTPAGKYWPSEHNNPTPSSGSGPSSKKQQAVKYSSSAPMAISSPLMFCPQMRTGNNLWRGSTIAEPTKAEQEPQL